MSKIAMLAGIAVVSLATNISAAEFPLEYKTIKPKEVMSFPGGYGAYGQLKTGKPLSIRKQPKATSHHPFYGLFTGVDKKGFLFRLDESKGDGKGYDEMIVDMNQNGDLTDDAALKPALPVNKSGNYEHAIFGPFEAPTNKMIGAWRPIFYAEANVFSRDFKLTGGMNKYYGSARIKAGWYAESKIEVDGKERKIALFDGNSNMRLGDVPVSVTYNDWQDGESWSFSSGDSFLQDCDGSGNFESDSFDKESCAFGELIYVGSAPFKASLGSDGRTLRLDPWADPLAEVTLQPHGDQVSVITLALEKSSNNWALIKTPVAAGKIKVPPGNYRLCSCGLTDKPAEGEATEVFAYLRKLFPPVRVELGKANELLCGGPLEVKVKATKSDRYVAPNGVVDTKPGDALDINANVIGKGGETYSSFSQGKRMPPKPTFAITNSEGKEVAKGSLEYG